MSGEGTFEPWPRLIGTKCWIDSSGVAWRPRGGAGASVEERDLRRLSKRHDAIRVVHVYDEIIDVEGEALSELLGRVREFWAGEAPPHAGFRLAEFRDGNRNVLLVIEEWC